MPLEKVINIFEKSFSSNEKQKQQFRATWTEHTMGMLAEHTMSKNETKKYCKVNWNGKKMVFKKNSQFFLKRKKLFDSTETWLIDLLMFMFNTRHLEFLFILSLVNDASYVKLSSFVFYKSVYVNSVSGECTKNDGMKR